MISKIPYFIILCIFSMISCKNQPTSSDQLPQTVQLDEYTGNVKSLLDSMAQGKPVTIVCYGNSITYGWRGDSLLRADIPYPAALQASLTTHYSNTYIQVINEGHGGWVASQGADSLGNLVLSHHPDLCIIDFGINDVNLQRNINDYRSDLEKMCDSLQAAHVKVLIMAPTPILIAANTQLVNFCKMAQNVAADKAVGFVNMHYRIVKRMENDHLSPIHVLPDKVHFTNSSYALMSEELEDYLYGL